MRRNAGPPEEGDQTPLHFTVGSDSDEEDSFPEKASTPTPPLFRNIRDTHAPPSYAHVLINRLLLRIFPRVLLLLLLILLIVALIPGGWRVALCAANILPPPTFERDHNVTIIGHRGCEFPYPENSAQALKSAVEVTSFVEFDIGLTSDQKVVLIHDIAYNRTTNGTGLTCMEPLSYVKSLQVKMPDRDPRGHFAQGQFCVEKNRVGTTPCVYRVPTIGEVFEMLPISTRFMIDIKECYAPGITVSSALCSNCTILSQQVRENMERHFINPNRVVFTSSELASLVEFRKGMQTNSTYALGADGRYSRHTKKAFLKVLDDASITSTSMAIALAALRPDLLRAVRKSESPDGSGPREVYVWTVRRDIDFKLGRCAGASNLIVAEPNRMEKQLRSGEVGSLLSEAS